MKPIALFPGSFDPITRGHESIVVRAIPLFEKIIIAIGHNSEKQGLFPVEKRMEWIRLVFKDHPSVEVIEYQGLTVDLCRKLGVRFILRGLRTSADFEFERSIGQMNKKMHPDIETVFMLTVPEHTAITSSIVRDIIRNGGDASQFVPDQVKF
ncbi:MAG: pantetheine-phosphate adenylyltransferase [Bacteroidales bacterium]|jgi:pantetheine-phosphate adenylyltransferase|nr:pantetheine-phosphate adenylyltransferase [Bacteroidales bacterium]NLM91634.1 pantetheine-phosphate adenylyltransferase [Bacteroidales bacterium]